MFENVLHRLTKEVRSWCVARERWVVLYKSKLDLKIYFWIYFVYLLIIRYEFQTHIESVVFFSIFKVTLLNLAHATLEHDI